MTMRRIAVVTVTACWLAASTCFAQISPQIISIDANETTQLTSPLYPSNYTNNEDMTWIIRTDEDRRIQITFAVFRTESGYDFLRAGHGDNSSDSTTTFFEWSGTDLPPDVVSFGNVMWLTFTSDGSVSDTGFSLLSGSIQYTGFIRQTIYLGENETTEITSPLYPNNYINNADETWIIRTDEGRRINITFSEFSLESGYDFLRAGHGDNSSDSTTVFFERSGTDLPANVVSYANVMWLRFTSDFNIFYTGFSVSAGSIPSRGYIRQIIYIGADEKTEISSPLYPNNYFNNADETWIIRTDEGRRINITFAEFSLESRYDFFRAGHGDDSSDSTTTFLERSGTDLPSALISFGNEMWLRFTTDGSVITSGFLLSACSVSSTGFIPQAIYIGADETIEIASPLYPSNYINNADETWVIRTDEGRRVNITFAEFNLESGYDFLRAGHGDNSSDSTTTYFERSGTDLPADVISFGSEMWLRFTTDGSVIDTGFLLSARSIFSSGLIRQIIHISADDKTEINSPLYPNNYINNADETWVIRTKESRRINITFTEFSLESGYDFLRAGHGDDSSDPTTTFLVRSGTDLPPDVVSFGNEMWLRFTTDGSVIARGFLLSACSVSSIGFRRQTIYLDADETTEITSPLYPNNYVNNADETWVIEAKEGRRIQITFATFATQSGYDFLRAGHGDNSSYSTTTFFEGSGTDLPPAVASFGNVMWLRFKSDGSVTDNGFSISATSVPSAGLRRTIYLDADETTEIASPLYPNNYINNAEETWVIRTVEDRRIHIKFASFDTETGYDFVRAGNGDNSSYITTTFFESSGSDVPEDLVSFGNEMWLRFTSDGSVTNSGFSVSAQSVSSIVLRRTMYVNADETAEVTSLFYPNKYTNSNDIIWVIRTYKTHKIHITFTAFRTELDFDFLRAGDGDDSSDITTMFFEWSGSNEPPEVFSSGNEMWLRFTSDGSVTSSGFSLSARSVLSTDRQPPVIENCPLDVRTNVAIVTWSSVPTATDNDGTTPIIVTCDRVSSSVFPVDATTLVVCRASDAAGNEANCTFTVTVDQQPPVINNCPSDIWANNVQATWSPHPTAIDDDGTSPDVICDPALGSSFPVDTTTAVTCHAHDTVGNEARCTFTVTVDLQAPIISNCPSDITSNRPVVTWSPAPIAIDNYNSSLDVICDPASGSEFPIDSITTVFCTARDSAGNEDHCAFIVSVEPFVVGVTMAINETDGGDVRFIEAYNDIDSEESMQLCQPFEEALLDALTRQQRTAGMARAECIAIYPGSVIVDARLVFDSNSANFGLQDDVESVLRSAVIAGTFGINGDTTYTIDAQSVFAQSQLTTCPVDYCQNGGNCIQEGSVPRIQFHCNCPNEFTGEFCELQLSDGAVIAAVLVPSFFLVLATLSVGFCFVLQSVRRQKKTASFSFDFQLNLSEHEDSQELNYPPFERDLMPKPRFSHLGSRLAVNRLAYLNQEYTF